MKYLLLDMNNILYRNFHGMHDENDIDIIVAECHRSALVTINYFYKKYKPDDIVIAFDSFSWRKAYTQDDFFYKKYKGHRRKNLTSKQEEQLKVFDSHVQYFHELLKTNSEFIVLKRKLLEADDLIAGFIDSHKNDQHILLSSDKDYIQLLDNANLTIIDPVKDNKRTLLDWNLDSNLFMFEKCIRGDQSDNIMSSYPRLTSKKLVEAYNDPYKQANIMDHEFKVEFLDQNGELKQKEYKTGEVFKENMLLMNLRQQPEEIKTLMRKTIEESKNCRGKYNYIKFVQFCGKHDLISILENTETFGKLLSLQG